MGFMDWDWSFRILDDLLSFGFWSWQSLLLVIYYGFRYAEFTISSWEFVWNLVTAVSANNLLLINHGLITKINK